MLALLWESFYTCALVFGFGYLLNLLAYRHVLRRTQWGGRAVSKKSFKAVKHKAFDERHTRNNLLLKWMDFGGGLYGTVAMVRLLFIEIAEIRDFFADWTGIGNFIGQLGLDTLIKFFIEQFMNFISASVWPVHYLGHLEFLPLLIFIAALWCMYTLSEKLARLTLTKLLAAS